MFKEDFHSFCQLLDNVSELRQLPVLSADAKTLFFRAVSHYTIQQVQGAIQAHLLDPEAGKFKTQLQPSHIVAQIEKAMENDGRPDADEAWAIALESTDEMATVVWTDEIAQAMSAAQPVMDSGDRTGARMAFKAAYARLVSRARNEGVATRWTPSLGQDADQREYALQKAVSAGLLQAPQVAGLLPPPEPESQISEEEAQENIKRIKQMLADALSPSEKMAARRAQEVEAERKRLDELKRESQQKVSDVMGGGNERI